MISVEIITLRYDDSYGRLVLTFYINYTTITHNTSDWPLTRYQSLGPTLLDIISHTSHNILTNIFTILGFCSPNGREEVNCIGLPSFQYINMSNFTTTHFKCPHILSSPSNLALFKHPFVSQKEISNHV